MARYVPRRYVLPPNRLLRVYIYALYFISSLTRRKYAYLERIGFTVMSLLTRCTVPATVATTSSPSANVPWPLNRAMSRDFERNNFLPHELQRRGHCLARCY